MKALGNSILVSISIPDRQQKGMMGKLLLPVFMRPLAYHSQVGKVLSVGEFVEGVQIGDELLFHHNIEDTDENIIKVNPGVSETRIITIGGYDNAVMGIVREGKIIPQKNYVICDRYWLTDDVNLKQDSGLNIIELAASENTIFQTEICYIGLDEKYFKVGDKLGVLPKSNYTIIYGDRPLWFINKKDIVFLNNELLPIRIKVKTKKKSADDIQQDFIIRVS